MKMWLYERFLTENFAAELEAQRGADAGLNVDESE